MTLKQILFGLDGRLARLPFLGCGLLALLVVTFGMLVAFGFLYLGVAYQNDGKLIIGVLIGMPTFIAFFWAGLALTIKRLHDMGLAGSHVIWIFILNIAGIAGTQAYPALGIILGLLSFGVALWLFLAPGQAAANTYGAIPD